MSCPARISGHARSCGSVAAEKRLLNQSAINGWKSCIVRNAGQKRKVADRIAGFLSTASQRSQPRSLQQAYSLSRIRRRVRPFPHRSRPAPVTSVVEPPRRSCGLRMRTSSTCAQSAVGREYSSTPDRVSQPGGLVRLTPGLDAARKTGRRPVGIVRKAPCLSRPEAGRGVSVRPAFA